MGRSRRRRRKSNKSNPNGEAKAEQPSDTASNPRLSTDPPPPPRLSTVPPLPPRVSTVPPPRLSTVPPPPPRPPAPTLSGPPSSKDRNNSNVAKSSQQVHQHPRSQAAPDDLLVPENERKSPSGPVSPPAKGPEQPGDDGESNGVWITLIAGVLATLVDRDDIQNITDFHEIFSSGWYDVEERVLAKYTPGPDQIISIEEAAEFSMDLMELHRLAGEMLIKLKNLADVLWDSWLGREDRRNKIFAKLFEEPIQLSEDQQKQRQEWAGTPGGKGKGKGKAAVKPEDPVAGEAKPGGGLLDSVLETALQKIAYIRRETERLGYQRKASQKEAAGPSDWEAAEKELLQGAQLLIDLPESNETPDEGNTPPTHQGRRLLARWASKGHRDVPEDSLEQIRKAAQAFRGVTSFLKPLADNVVVAKKALRK